MASKCDEDILGMPPDLQASLAALPSFSHPLHSPLSPFGPLPAQYQGTSYNPLSSVPFGSSWYNSRPPLREATLPGLGSLRLRHSPLEEESLHYHHPRTKHYDDKMEKQRLEHMLFAGSDYSPLDRQKERMRRKLRSKVDRKKAPKARDPEDVPNVVDDHRHSAPSLPATASTAKRSSAADKRRKKKHRQRRKAKGPKQRNKRRGANGPDGADSKKGATASPPSTATESVSMSSVSPHCDSLEGAMKELDELALDTAVSAATAPSSASTKWSKSTKSTASKMRAEAAADAVDGVSDAFESSMDRDIDDGDHEDSFSRMEAEHALLDELETAKTEEAAARGLTVDDGESESKEAMAATAQRQSAEIEMLKESVSTLIDTVSKLEELVLFHKSNAMPSPPPSGPSAGKEHDDRRCQAMAEEIESLKERVHDLERGTSGRCGSKHEAFRRWLAEEVELGQYVHVLIDHGFEDLVAAQTLTMEVLDAVDGIDKIGHKLRILNFVQKLKDAAEETHEF